MAKKRICLAKSHLLFDLSVGLKIYFQFSLLVTVWYKRNIYVSQTLWFYIDQLDRCECIPFLAQMSCRDGLRASAYVHLEKILLNLINCFTKPPRIGYA